MVKIIENRDERIISAALQLAEADHYNFITRDQVARAAGVSPALINSVHGTMVDLKRAVLKAAVERRVVPVVAQGLGDRHPIVLEAPEDLRREAAIFLVTV